MILHMSSNDIRAESFAANVISRDHVPCSRELKVDTIHEEARQPPETEPRNSASGKSELVKLLTNPADSADVHIPTSSDSEPLSGVGSDSTLAVPPNAEQKYLNCTGVESDDASAELRIAPASPTIGNSSILEDSKAPVHCGAQGSPNPMNRQDSGTSPDQEIINAVGSHDGRPRPGSVCQPARGAGCSPPPPPPTETVVGPLPLVRAALETVGISHPKPFTTNPPPPGSLPSVGAVVGSLPEVRAVASAPARPAGDPRPGSGTPPGGPPSTDAPMVDIVPIYTGPVRPPLPSNDRVKWPEPTIPSHTVVCMDDFEGEEIDALNKRIYSQEECYEQYGWLRLKENIFSVAFTSCTMLVPFLLIAAVNVVAFDVLFKDKDPGFSPLIIHFILSMLLLLFHMIRPQRAVVTTTVSTNHHILGLVFNAMFYLGTVSAYVYSSRVVWHVFDANLMMIFFAVFSAVSAVVAPRAMLTNDCASKYLSILLTSGENNECDLVLKTDPKVNGSGRDACKHRKRTRKSRDNDRDSVIADARVRFGVYPPERNQANLLSVSNYCANRMREGGVRPSHINRVLPEIVAAVFTPSPEQIRAHRISQCGYSRVVTQLVRSPVQ